MKKCFYCGNDPQTIITQKSTGINYIYNGIDRKNSSIGYRTENCVTCCKTCNFFKMKLSVDNFLNHVKKIYEYSFVGNKR